MTGGWLVRRVLLALLAAFGIGVLVFTLLRLIPGDVVTQLIGLEGNVSAAQQAEMRRLFDLDQPIWMQFLNWFGTLLRGDFGVSLRTDRPVFTDLLLRFPVTLQLSAMALLFALLVGLPLGILAALKRKLVYGSDSDLNRITGDVQRWKDAFDAMGLSADDQEQIFYRNAAHIFGIDGA